MTQTTQEPDVRAVGTRPEQLDRFYREHRPYVRQYVARRRDDPGDVADVTADIFLRVVRPPRATGRSWDRLGPG